jgi:DNA topoisomerase-1
VPARKKQASEAGTPLATGRKKAATSRKKTDETALPAKKGRASAAVKSGGTRKHDLVIVESPAKAKTINKYLGANFKVLASYGHVRDLPRRRKKGEQVAGINIEDGWIPTYVVESKEDGGRGGQKTRRRTPKEILTELKREAAKADRVFLATDPDREGEAIAWHIEDELKLDEERTFRITFNEITRTAVQNALKNPGKVDMDRVHAQEARRILDRVVGYPLSNLLNRKVARQLSAGRVQSVALRLVVDREREIEAFKTEEYWKITALLAPQGTVAREAFQPYSVVLAKPRGAALKADAEDGEKEPEKKIPEGSFLAELAEWAGKKFESATRENTEVIAGALDKAAYQVTKVEQTDRNEKAPPPFKTSTLQQQANLRLRFTSDRTMRAAQKLYEGVDLGSEGAIALITYMRTDSLRVSDDALKAVRSHIDAHYGPAYLPPKPNFFASGKSAQEAHEAIRPTDLSYTPERVAKLGLHGDELRMYTLIYHRFVASQMMPAIFAVTNIEVTATSEAGAGLFKAQGKILKFDGYRKVLAPGKQEDATLPQLAEKQALDRLELTASQHFTQPPPRYNEASLIKALEKEGIGRPSTYASIIHKITSDKRSYIEVKERRFFATETGKRVTDLLVEHFPKVMDVKFTSHFEEELDQIETREMQYNQVLDEFWGPFSEALRTAEEKMPVTHGIETGEKCPQCGRNLVKNYSKKLGREFVGCPGYRDKENPCRYIQPVEGEEPRPQPVETDVKCPNCGKPMLERMGRTGRFLGCSGYPECKTTMNYDAEGKPQLSAKPTEHTCDKCGKPMVIREGRRGPFMACTGYPKCKNTMDVDKDGNPIKPVDLGIKCEKCGKPMAVKKGFGGRPFLGCTGYPSCRSTMKITEELQEKLKDQLPAAPPKKQMPAVQVSETCPECGAAMKLRQARGNYFLGCSKYPRCKGTREATPEILEQVAATAATTS